MRLVSTKTDEQTWRQISTKLKDVEALKVLHELVNYVSERLKSRIDEVKSSRDAISFFSKGREFLTINITRTNLRIYFQPSSGALFSKDHRFAVENVSLWEGSFQKATDKYKALTAWVSKEEHLPAIKKMIDTIPLSTTKNPT